MTRPTRDAAFAKHHADREEQFHRILVATGLRPEGSKAEEFRQDRAPAEVAPVKAAGRLSEAAE